MSGGEDAFDAFRELMDFLLRRTVLHDTARVRLISGPKLPHDRLSLGGWNGPNDPLRLRDNAYLRLSMTLYREPSGSAAHRLKVEAASYQYQLDNDGKKWVFRYDYARDPCNRYPANHLQVNGTLTESQILAPNRPLARLHFPTDRVSIEAVIRLLIIEFNVPTARDEDHWRPLLLESERAFKAIAHRE
jgi:hypothetical protein